MVSEEENKDAVVEEKPEEEESVLGFDKIDDEPKEEEKPEEPAEEQKPVEQPPEREMDELEIQFPKTIFAVKTAIGYEKMVANSIAGRSKRRGGDIYAILSPTKLRGYLLVEGVKNVDAINDLIKGLEHIRGVIEGDTAIDDRCIKCKTTISKGDTVCPNCGATLDADNIEKGIAHFLEPKTLVAGIAVGDIVEIISGPFKGEKARVQQIDESKEEITVELFEAMVSIPVTIRGDSVRVLEREKEAV